MRDDEVARLLLAWYDIHARVMPWRVSPQDRAAGVTPDPYRVWLSEVMLQQTTVAAVRGYFRRFTELWPSVQALAGAEDGAVMGEWAGLGYYARARNLLACARVVVADHGGQFPDTEAGLRALPGVGAYTAAAVAAIAFDRAAAVVDGNVERVMARLHAVTEELPGAKGALVTLAGRHTPQARPGDYAQAVMDLGATICTPRNPACGICPVNGLCAARAQGIAAELPRKARKAAKSVRQGRVWVVVRPDGGLLLEQRPAKGLLGGMLGFPGDGWDGFGQDMPPVQADWHEAGEVRHIFTHIDLRLTVMVGRVEGPALRGQFLPPETPLPTLMDKARALALAQLEANLGVKGGHDEPSPSAD
ncbi:A/G-specific adenine glycosylase [Neogemmobacter tilapiae]|uniref:Adenine DNA glycosylase n=1 Tax=Neogemmobacter tilapiae TaxID=875041 RepID=A0A918WMM9_9RHOB|nr:A/G-specific adenine glycosylase [Gemmobacter tilapiae]GHC64379.1 A/G-specific adenine glycosylase [Gemmobacter tilapiae]